MDLKERVKKLGFRVTKDVKGKRVKLTKKELQAKIDRKKKKSQPTLENQARDAKKFIRVCKMVLREAESNAPRVVRQRRSATAPVPPPPPPPPMRAPPKPVINNARARLMAELKANPKFRNLRAN
jgi:organic radical activating enzyme